MGCCVIEILNPEDFIAACLAVRAWRRGGPPLDSWEGVLRRKWIALAMEQTQYQIEEVNPYG